MLKRADQIESTIPSSRRKSRPISNMDTGLHMTIIVARYCSQHLERSTAAVIDRVPDKAETTSFQQASATRLKEQQTCSAGRQRWFVA